MSFIDDVRSEYSARDRSPSLDYEDVLINGAVEGVKSGIRKAVEASKNEFWYMERYVWVYDEWMNESKSSLSGGSWGEVESYRTDESDCGILGGYFNRRVSGIVPYKEGWDIDFEYIRRSLEERLWELGCKKVDLVIGPVRIPIYRWEKGLFGTKKKVPTGNDKVVYKWAVRVSW